MASRPDIYRGRDPRDLPVYSVADAARIVGMSAATLRSWAYGRHYPITGGRRKWPPLIKPADPKLLSFRNLVELHVLGALRGVRNADPRRISVQKIRRARGALEEQIGTDHPLADVDLHTDWQDIYASILGELVNVSDPQQQLREVLEPYLQRIERDERGLAQRLYPGGSASSAKLVVIDPRRRFGRPVLARANVETAIIGERFVAGDDVRDIARDLELDEVEVNAAIRFETALRSRAA